MYMNLVMLRTVTVVAARQIMNCVLQRDKLLQARLCNTRRNSFWTMTGIQNEPDTACVWFCHQHRAVGQALDIKDLRK